MWSWLSYARPSFDLAGPRTPTGEEPKRDGLELPRLREALPWVSAEFARARRYERPVTVVVLSGTEGGCDLRTLGRMGLREVDLVCSDAEGGRCIVVLPEIGPEEGERAARRLQRMCVEHLGQPILAGVATFPRDGWMFPDLVSAAEKHARAEVDAESPTPAAVSASPAN